MQILSAYRTRNGTYFILPEVFEPPDNFNFIQKLPEWSLGPLAEGDKIVFINIINLFACNSTNAAFQPSFDISSLQICCIRSGSELHVTYLESLCGLLVFETYSWLYQSVVGSYDISLTCM